MVIDTSAIVAVLFDEPGAARFRVLIAADPLLLVSVATVLEATLVVEGRARQAEDAVDNADPRRAKIPRKKCGHRLCLILLEPSRPVHIDC